MFVSFSSPLLHFPGPFYLHSNKNDRKYIYGGNIDSINAKEQSHDLNNLRYVQGIVLLIVNNQNKSFLVK